ncbi:MAG: GAF domain-containing sensor histidine kinase [Chloroflexi bacterium]|nr:GAF domain-containing sensor histidine kinase [Chloroflexota bacterium]
MVENRIPATQWTALGLRLLVAASAVVLSLAGVTGSLANNDVLSMTLTVIGLSNLAVTITLLTRGLRRYASIIQSAADWLTAGAVAVLTQGHGPSLLLIVVGIGGVGMNRLEWPWGALAGLGTFIAVAVGLVLGQPEGVEALQGYWEIAIVAAIALLVSWIWQWAYSRYGSASAKSFRKTIEQKDADLATIREGSRSVLQVATSLNTNSYQKILDAALDVGRLGLRRNTDSRVVGMVLLVRAADDQLQIVNSRGLPHYDVEKLFPGRAGVIGEALSEGVPKIGTLSARDPELAEVVAFARMRSIMAVPLRAQYVNYGVLIFGTSDVDAFSADVSDVLQAIGTQVTVALQNASLYMNLVMEKERIVRLEQNARQALVRDLHDIPTQTISAVTMRTGIVKMLLDRGQTDKLRQEVEAVEDLAKQATAEIRHVLFKLRPLALETQGLGAALTQLVDKTRKTFGQNILLKIDEQVDHLLHTEAQDALFYLIEEAVSNARKYAEAQTIRIDIAAKDDQVIVRVADNGVGFDVEKVQAKYVERGSFGMMNMEERAELIGGRLNLQSQPGKGTVVTVTVPLDASDTEGKLQYTVSQMKLGRTPATGLR